MNDKPLLMLIHGWGANGSVWDGIRSQLEDQYEVRTPELPGHGACAWHQDDSDGLIDRLRDEAGRSAFWLGWSLGALLTMQVALQAPQLVRGMLLVSATPAFKQANDWQSAMLEDVFDRFYADFQDDPDRTLQRFLALQVQGDRYAQSVLRQLKIMAGQHIHWGRQSAVWGLDRLRAMDLRQNLADIQHPVHLLHGTNDQIIPVAAGQYLAEKTDGNMTVWEQTGHAPFVSRPDKFVRWIAQATS